MQRQFWFLLYGTLLLIFNSACNSIGVYRPEATEAALQGTLSALQGTIAALQTPEATVQTQPTAQIIVVTATPTLTATPSPTPAIKATASATAVAPSPTVAPSQTGAGSSQGETIQMATLPPTPGPTSTPTTAAYLEAPLLVEPDEGAIVEQGRSITLGWTWPGSLGPDEHFDIKVKPDGQDSSAYVAWEEGETHEFTADLRPGRYYWSVQVIKGHYKGDGRAPEDRVFEAFLGPESELRLIIIGQKPPKSPHSISQADPPAPSMPYALLFGSAAFVAFAQWNRRRHQLIPNNSRFGLKSRSGASSDAEG